jgi:hypothetical protein
MEIKSGVSGSKTLSWCYRPSRITAHFSQKVTPVGVVRFLDNFGDLYDNRLDLLAHQRSEMILEKVMRAFCSVVSLSQRI